MKRLIPALLALLLLLSCACADDPFLDSFNGFASAMYGLPQAKPASANSLYTIYQADTYALFKDFADNVEISGPLSNTADVLTAACCVLRTVKNSGSPLDQYGRIMHAYFMCRSRDPNTEYRATTECGALVYVSRTDTTLTIRIIY